MTPTEFTKGKTSHLMDRNETEDYQKRGIRFTDMMFEDGGRPRRVIIEMRRLVSVAVLPEPAAAESRSVRSVV